MSEFSFKNDFEIAFVNEKSMIIQNKPFQIEVSAIEVKEREQTKMVETMYNTIELMKCFCFISISSSCFSKCASCFINIFLHIHEVNKNKRNYS